DAGAAFLELHIIIPLAVCHPRELQAPLLTGADAPEASLAKILVNNCMGHNNPPFTPQASSYPRASACMLVSRTFCFVNFLEILTRRSSTLSTEQLFI